MVFCSQNACTVKSETRNVGDLTTIHHQNDYTETGYDEYGLLMKLLFLTWNSVRFAYMLHARCIHFFEKHIWKFKKVVVMYILCLHNVYTCFLSPHMKVRCFVLPEGCNEITREKAPGWRSQIDSIS